MLEPLIGTLILLFLLYFDSWRERKRREFLEKTEEWKGNDER